MSGVSVATAGLPKVGEKISGDVAAIVPVGRATLVCLADGLGHGVEANAAAERACAYVKDSAMTPLDRLLRGVDRVLVGTRGAAVSLLLVDPMRGELQFAGVGNVELRAASRTRIAPPTTPGIVGHGIRSARVWSYAIATGDVLVLLSDGISSRFDLAELAHLDAPALADALLRDHRKRHDDALCVVARVEA
jgi:hypothetical protein